AVARMVPTPSPSPERPAPSSAPPLSALVPTPHPGAVADELDRIARRKQSGPGPTGPGLSPNMIAIIGGLLGLTAITTLGLFLGRTEMKPLVLSPVEEKQEA